MKRLVCSLLLASAALFADGLPMSKELVQGDVSIMLGRFNPGLVAQMAGVDPDSMFFQGECVQVLVSTSDPSAGRFNVSVVTRQGKRFSFSHQTGPRDKYLPFTIFILQVPGGAFEDVTDVWVDKLPPEVPTTHFSTGTVKTVRP